MYPLRWTSKSTGNWPMPLPWPPSVGGGTWWDPSPTAARRPLITADVGGSNGHRMRLWKLEFARLAARAPLEITVCYFLPGISKMEQER